MFSTFILEWSYIAKTRLLMTVTLTTTTYYQLTKYSLGYLKSCYLKRRQFDIYICPMQAVYVLYIIPWASRTELTPSTENIQIDRNSFDNYVFWGCTSANFECDKENIPVVSSFLLCKGIMNMLYSMVLKTHSYMCFFYHVPNERCYICTHCIRWIVVRIVSASFPETLL